MLVFTPPPPPPLLFSTYECPLTNPIIGYDPISYSFKQTQPSNHPPISNFLPFDDPLKILSEFDHQSTAACDSTNGDPTIIKKLNHNASERDRRKKMNTLYSSLRSLLPASDQMKKMSIPATVSRVLKYIPELQQQVERLAQRKEEILLQISKQDDFMINQQILNQRKGTNHSTSSVVSVNQLSDKEVSIQISAYGNTIHTSQLSEILHFLEEEGLFLINSSSFESYGGRTFNNLHVQVEGADRIECDALSKKLACLYEKSEQTMFP